MLSMAKHLALCYARSFTSFRMTETKPAMFRKLILTIFFGLSVLVAPAAVDSTLVRDHSDSIRVSLVTCSPGTEVYEVYGHTALRVEIPSLGVDVAVNYGLFSFEAPNFVWRFIKGETDYVVGTIGYPIFEREYTSRGSSVTLQTLNLSAEEKERLVYLLNENLRPENREYRYNFLYNNCSNKAASKVEEALALPLAEIESREEGITYRDILHEYTQDYPWLQFGIDYLLGFEADRLITPREQMFAPEYLQYYTAHSELSGDSLNYPYVIEEQVIEALVSQDEVSHFMLSPVQMMILLILFVAVVCTLEILLEHRQWWLDVVLLSLQGIMGCVVAFLFFCSEHPAVGSNLHVIYLNPLPLLFMPFIIYSTVKRRVSPLYYVLALLMVLFVVVSLLHFQYIQLASYLFVAALLMRVLHILWAYPFLRRRFIESQRQQSKPLSTRVRTILVVALLGISTSAMHAGEVPKVVVSIVVDQLRTDYLEKFADLYGEGGFKKLLAEGHVYTNGYFSHSTPDRSSATASVYAGCTPYYHGVTGNRFMERSTLRVMGTVDDAEHKGINTNETASPSRLVVTTLTDELKVATKGHSYVCSIAPERDMAVLAGGHAPNAVLWLSEDQGMWATSTYYNGAPSWVATYNRREDTRFDWKSIEWEPYYSTGVYSYSVYDGIPKGFRYTFRKGDAEAIRRYKTSACINDEVTMLAKTCVAGSMFGRNKTTDMLCIGYYAGNYEHAPEWELPIEQQDIYCRLDRNIADLIAAVEAKVGVGNALFVITSTGYADAHRPVSKLFLLPGGELKMDRCCALLNVYLGALYGRDNYVEGSYRNEIYLNHALIEKKQMKLTELLESCTEFLSMVKGVKQVHTSLDLFSGNADQKVRGAYNADRSGDLILEVAPGWTLDDERWGEEIYYNRTHVPMPIIYYGGGMQAQYNRTPVSAESIAPTVAHILRISAPNACSTRPLE